MFNASERAADASLPALTPAEEQLLAELTSLRAQLRQKRWQAAAQHLPESLERALPQLKKDLATLLEAAKAVEDARPQDALTGLERIELPLLLGEAHTLRGTALVYLGEPDAAKAAFEQALAADPYHYRAATNLGNVFLETGDAATAMRHYERALKINPDFAAAHHNLGVALRREGKISRSVASLRHAQRLGRQEQREAGRELLKNWFTKSKR